MEYSVSPRTLKKWSDSKLEILTPAAMPGRDAAAKAAYPEDARGFTFLYDGSTCNNGGTPYRALLHVILSGSGPDCDIVDAGIEIPGDQEEAASEMCAAPGKGAADARPFFDRLLAPAVFVGRSLEDVIREDVPENFAGCFCGKPHVNQKWNIALSTIHFRLSAGES